MVRHRRAEQGPEGAAAVAGSMPEQAREGDPGRAPEAGPPARRLRRPALVAALVGALLLAGCGGGQDVAAVPSAKGPISRACLEAGRAAASERLCGCVQAVADRTLSGREQLRGARFFREPHMAQEVRQSDRAGDEALWVRWRAFGEAAEAICRAA